MGRYGPDEFLLVAPPAVVADLEPRRPRPDGLADLSLQFEATERLPVTVSAGLATYPEHGASVTLLLAAVARSLQEAKASGGDTVRVAGRSRTRRDSHASTSSQGLVLAVDTKDRYTKRHSEDVARYAMFLASAWASTPTDADRSSVAGCCTMSARSVSRTRSCASRALTDSEFAIVKQHVALGDMIVRDLPDIDLVRPASATTTSGGTATATSTGSRARTSR